MTTAPGSVTGSAPGSGARGTRKLTPHEQAVAAFGAALRKWVEDVVERVETVAATYALQRLALLGILASELWPDGDTGWDVPYIATNVVEVTGDPVPPKKAPKALLDLIAHATHPIRLSDLAKIGSAKLSRELFAWRGLGKLRHASEPVLHHLATCLGVAAEPPPTWDQFKPAPPPAPEDKAVAKPAKKQAPKKKSKKKPTRKRKAAAA